MPGNRKPNETVVTAYFTSELYLYIKDAAKIYSRSVRKQMLYYLSLALNAKAAGAALGHDEVTPYVKWGDRGTIQSNGLPMPYRDKRVQLAIPDTLYQPLKEMARGHSYFRSLGFLLYYLIHNGARLDVQNLTRWKERQGASPPSPENPAPLKVVR